MTGKIRTFVINLDHDRERFDRIASSVAGLDCIALARVPAIKGSDLPLTARATLAGREAWASKAGEIGCFLSHVKAWERVAAEPDRRFCVILEDDAVPHGLARLASLQIPADADFVFINNRMVPGQKTGAPTLPITFVTVAECLKLIPDDWGGAGGDGYILTPIGARKLLNIVAQDLFFGHVDVRLLRYCVTVDDLAGALDGTRIAEIIRTHHNPQRMPAWGVLRAYCTSTPLIHHGTDGRSSRARITEEAAAP